MRMEYFSPGIELVDKCPGETGKLKREMTYSDDINWERMLNCFVCLFVLFCFVFFLFVVFFFFFFFGLFYLYVKSVIVT